MAAEIVQLRESVRLWREGLGVTLLLIRAVVEGEAQRGEPYEYESASGNGGSISSRRGDLCDMRDAVLRTTNDVAEKAGVDLTAPPPVPPPGR